MGSLSLVADLRSDTLTKPTTGMLQAMFSADVGDDVWGGDPTVNRLQAALATIFGMEAGLFCPSGTMTNQIAIKIHTQPGDELLCSDSAHIYHYEGGGIAFNSGVQAKLLPGVNGCISAAQVSKAINFDDPHFPASRLVCLENTCNRAGGSTYSLEAMQDISKLCRSKGIKIHLDGARFFNALVEHDYSALEVGRLFDTISICLSKGLGCPVGSVLLGSSADIAKARRVRKVLGGGMRQAGYLAAAGLYALQHNIVRLKEDHDKAHQLAHCLTSCAWVKEVWPVKTNIVMLFLQDGHEVPTAIAALAARGVLCGPMGDHGIRLVTHLDVSDEAVAHACEVFRTLTL